MRVLHIVEATIAGVRTHVQTLVTGLEQRGVQSTVACPLRRQNSHGDDQFVNYLTTVGIPVLPVGMQRSIDLRADSAALRRLITILRQGHYDILHLHSSKAGFLGRLAARVSGSTAAVVYSPHGLAFLGAGSGAKKQFYLRLEQVAGNFCDRIIAVSPGERELVIRNGLAPAERVACINLGVDPEPLPAYYSRTMQRRELGVPNNALLVGTIARATPQKNPFLFAEAAAKVIHAHPNAHFLWCGDGELRPAAEARIQALGIAERCTFLGHREDAQQVLGAFDLFWLTSNYESFGLATAEAMAQQVPVVATNVVGTRDVVVDDVTGLLVPPGDADALANATLYLLNNPAAAQSLGVAARQRVLKHYNVEQMINATIALYESVQPAEHAKRRFPLPAHAMWGAQADTSSQSRANQHIGSRTIDP